MTFVPFAAPRRAAVLAVLAVALAGGLARPGRAQHSGHQPAAPVAPVVPAAVARPAADSAAAVPGTHAMPGMHDMPGMPDMPAMPGIAPATSETPAVPGAAPPMPPMAGMPSAYSRNLPMSRNGSGTAWQPDRTAMYMWMQHRGPWMLMYHGSAFGRFTNVNFNNAGGRGKARAFDGPNWGMAMAQREIGARGLLNLSLMVSLDPLTETLGGYPLLLQTGESYRGQPLIDRQHPHDLVSGLSAGYTHALADDLDLSLYLGYPGEPALGPVAFMHRLSAMPNPDAPLSHHWTDATHISFGVATLGVRYRQFKLEGSNFTGREPDERRYDFDRPRADSWAARLSWNPTPGLALQASRAVIKSPEDLHPTDDATRTTASAQHSLPLGGERRYLASALVWGLNEGHDARPAHALLLETNLTLNRPTFYGRYEFVQKSAEELGLTFRAADQTPQYPVFNAHALTLGGSYRVAQPGGPRGPELHVGGQLTAHALPDDLRALYGRVPLSASVYVRLNAPWMRPM